MFFTRSPAPAQPQVRAAGTELHDLVPVTIRLNTGSETFTRTVYVERNTSLLDAAKAAFPLETRRGELGEWVTGVRGLRSFGLHEDVVREGPPESGFGAQFYLIKDDGRLGLPYTFVDGKHYFLAAHEIVVDVPAQFELKFEFAKEEIDPNRVVDGCGFCAGSAVETGVRVIAPVSTFNEKINDESFLPKETSVSIQFDSSPYKREPVPSTVFLTHETAMLDPARKQVEQGGAAVFHRLYLDAPTRLPELNAPQQPAHSSETRASHPKIPAGSPTERERGAEQRPRPVQIPAGSPTERERGAEQRPRPVQIPAGSPTERERLIEQGWLEPSRQRETDRPRPESPAKAPSRQAVQQPVLKSASTGGKPRRRHRVVKNETSVEKRTERKSARRSPEKADRKEGDRLPTASASKKKGSNHATEPTPGIPAVPEKKEYKLRPGCTPGKGIRKDGKEERTVGRADKPAAKPALLPALQRDERVKGGKGAQNRGPAVKAAQDEKTEFVAVRRERCLTVLVPRKRKGWLDAARYILARALLPRFLTRPLRRIVSFFFPK